MELTRAEVEQFNRDGYLVFPELFSRREISVLRAETARLANIEAETVIRERTGGVRSIFRVHEHDGATRSGAFRALVRTPRAAPDDAGAWHRRGVRLSHQDQHQAGDRGHGVDVAP